MKEAKENCMDCWIYSSPRQDQMYLYMSRKDGFDSLSDELMQRFGSPSLVMELALHPGQKLAREDVSNVMNNLKKQGYHLQMPPKIHVKMNDGE